MMARFHGMTVAAVAVILALSVGAAELSVANSPDAAGRIQSAAAGTVVVLAEGTYTLGDLNLPAGVSIRGVGYDKTILDAGGKGGLVLTGDKAATFSGFTIRNAAGAGIVIRGAKGQTVERVAIRDCGAGVLVQNATDCSLSNLVVANAQSGVIFTDSANCSLVSATLADVRGAGLRIGGSRDVTVFNTLVTGANFGIVLGEGNGDLAIDHNIYNAFTVGKMPGQQYRRKVEGWFHVSGFDKHSQTIEVKFADAAAGDFRVVSPLTWAPHRASTGLLGTMQLGGVQAPALDMNGVKRSERPDVGAFESSLTPSRKADGQFTVTRGAGVISAGLFDKDDKNVRYLFQNLPLTKGTYDYWLPSRDWQGREIPAGDYELRLLEADLKMEYIMAAGNGDLETSKRFSLSDDPNVYTVGSSQRNSLHPQAATFDAKGGVIVAQSGFECYQHIRLFTPDMGSIVWNVPGGAPAKGVAFENGLVYTLREPCSLIRVQADTGKPAPFADGSYKKEFDDIKAAWMTVMDGKMYVTETAANKVHVFAGDELDRTGSFEAESPTQITADTKNGLLWVLSGGETKQLIAFDASGKEQFKTTPVEQPIAVAANNGRLAVFSNTTNQVTIFDAANPKEPKKIRVIGTGGDGFGKILPDRFWNASGLSGQGHPVAIGLGGDGRLAVVDPPRTIVFDADGKLVRQMLGMWGQGISYGKIAGDDRWRFFNEAGEYDIILDTENKSWEPGTRWTSTMPMAQWVNHTANYFVIGDQTFCTFRGQKAKDWNGPMQLNVGRMNAETGVIHVLYRFVNDKEGLYGQMADANGIISDDAPKEFLKDGEGKNVQLDYRDRAFWSIDYYADGSIRIPRRDGMQILPLKGLDENGIPRYDFAKMRIVKVTVDGGKTTFISPYDFTTTDDVSIAADAAYFSDGTFAACASTKSGPGTDITAAHANTTNLAGFDAAGNMRWFRPFNNFGLKLGLQSVTTVGDLNFCGRGQLCEWEVSDRDGLSAGVLGPPPNMSWTGFWLDNHCQTHGITGNDGKPYMIVGDYMAQSYHWLSLTGHDKLLRNRQPVKIDATLAAAMAKDPAVPAPYYPAPQPPKFTVKKIDQDLPMDGDLAKWRGLGVTPFVVGPEQTRKADPRDISAVIRMAWNEKESKFYVQVIKFDDIVSFHQSPTRTFMQDSVEMCINLFFLGWKYDVTNVKGQDVVNRNGFGKPASGPLTPEQAPRKVTVLDNAKGVEERSLLEAAYGVDMSGCKVIVTEFVLTPETTANMGTNKDIPQMEFGSGKSFLVGFMITDGDVPGEDTVKYITWPIMYGTFYFSECFATATFE